MQQELWLRAKSQVLSSLKPVCAMRAAASQSLPVRSSEHDPQTAASNSHVLTQPHSPNSVRPSHVRTRASNKTLAFNNGTAYLHGHNREHVIKHDVSNSTLPEKAHNPIKASRSHQELHKELLLAHKKGLVMCCKPELQVVLERRKREQTEREEGEQNRSPLEQVFLKRQQKNQEKEKEHEEKVREEAQLLEFVRVRQNLKKVHSALHKNANS
ncbi:protein FAM107B [Chanos chanos]|uniref:Protein FAM107B n=1 Tax=Chanos chanos TaxID=29144 RepID=A0A6J2WAW9_CHACN|nr:protein FAM107B-like [Chanos chanos]